MSDPFGEMPTPWWQRIWRRGGRESVPRRYAIPSGAIGPIAALFLTAPHGMDTPTKMAIGFALFVTPPALIEMCWLQRQRRAEEQLQIVSGEPPKL